MYRSTALPIPILLPIPHTAFDDAVPFADSNELDPNDLDSGDLNSDIHNQSTGDALGTANLPRPPAPVSNPAAQAEITPDDDDFKVEYHPSSSIPTCIYHFNEYEHEQP